MGNSVNVDFYSTGKRYNQNIRMEYASIQAKAAYYENFMVASMLVPIIRNNSSIYFSIRIDQSNPSFYELVTQEFNTIDYGRYYPNDTFDGDIYFFIDSVTYINKKCVELTCIIDVWESFVIDNGGSTTLDSTIFSQSTLTLREHRHQYNGANYLIDDISENLSLDYDSPLADDQIEVTSGYEYNLLNTLGHCYLVYYQSNNYNSPLPCFIMIEKAGFYVSGATTTGVQTVISALASGSYVLLAGQIITLGSLQYTTQAGDALLVYRMSTGASKNYVVDSGKTTKVDGLSDGTSVTLAIGAGGMMLSLENFDLTDPKIAKIQQLPYYPAGFSVSGNVVTLPAIWTSAYIQQFAGTPYLNTALLPYNTLLTLSSMNFTVPQYIGDPNIGDTKINFSETRSLQLIFGPNNINIPLENYTTDFADFNFIVQVSVPLDSSNTIIIELLGQSFLSVDSIPYKMVIEQDMSVPLVTDEYLNYLRSQSNSDRINQNQKWISTGLSVVQTIVGGVLTATGGGAGVGAPLLIGGALSSAGSISSAGSSEAALAERRKAARENSSANTGNNNDLLIQNYLKNSHCYILDKMVRAKYVKDVLLKYFYTGYNTQLYKIPNTNTKTNFNFIQCIPVFTKYFPSYINDELTSLFSNGLVIIHPTQGNYLPLIQILESFTTTGNPDA
jgi:hypothetical protein